MKDNKCSDCTNDKGCINCENGNMKLVEMKEPEGALKELLDNIDPIEYEKTKQEMLKVTPNEEFGNFAKEYLEKETDNILCVYDRYAGLVDGVRWLLGKACKWWEDELSYPSMTSEEIKWYKNKVRKFRKAMEE